MWRALLLTVSSSGRSCYRPHLDPAWSLPQLKSGRTSTALVLQYPHPRSAPPNYQPPPSRFNPLQKWTNPVMGWTSTEDPMESCPEAALWFYTKEQVDGRVDGGWMAGWLDGWRRRLMAGGPGGQGADGGRQAACSCRLPASCMLLVILHARICGSRARRSTACMHATDPATYAPT